MGKVKLIVRKHRTAGEETNMVLAVGFLLLHRAQGSVVDLDSEWSDRRRNVNTLGWTQIRIKVLECFASVSWAANNRSG
ncbi:hypothetical protein BT63DRAFT_212261 [Microthyrium microscopicum]|uniref:Uncharacterized protein n=1 Tax=Microthyrium microscopicum TaxID=703497 RepID=A0A6A6UHW0_9PEZI|nr:hypothetical protein BT63DRAFT_212261 [Microthyrium microscopicum]